MSNGYVKSTWGCHRYSFDSSFKRYNRAHLGGDFTINIFSGANAGWGCGCGCGNVGGFWGGVGLALGNWAGNLLMGGMNMLGGWAGGLGGMFGGFGAGWGNFGGGWGNSGVKDDDYYASKYGNGKSGKTGDNQNGKDIDNPKFAPLNDRISDLRNDSEINANKIKKLYDEIKEAKDKTDDINKDADIRTYESYLKELKNLAKDKDFEIDANGNVTKVVNKPANSNASTGAIDGVGTPINNTPYTNNDLDKIVADLNNLPEVKALVGVNITNDNGKIKVSGILFPTGKADLTEEQEKALKAIANQLNATVCEIKVTGTTSRRPYRNDNNGQRNHELAKKRANAGKTVLEHNDGRIFTVTTDTDNMAGTIEEADKYQNIVLEINLQ